MDEETRIGGGALSCQQKAGVFIRRPEHVEKFNRIVGFYESCSSEDDLEKALGQELERAGWQVYHQVYGHSRRGTWVKIDIMAIGRFHPYGRGEVAECAAGRDFVLGIETKFKTHYEDAKWEQAFNQIDDYSKCAVWMSECGTIIRRPDWFLYADQDTVTKTVFPHGERLLRNIGASTLVRNRWGELSTMIRCPKIGRDGSRNRVHVHGVPLSLTGWFR